MSALEIHGITRGALLARGALATASAYGAGAVGPWVRRALAQQGGGDVDILNFALTLEYLEAEFYKQALQKVGRLSGEARDLARLLGEHEAEHVDTLTAAVKKLNGEPVKVPRFTFGDSFESEEKFLARSQDLEDLGVAAYNGTAPDIQSKDLLLAAGGIVQVEARHAASIRQLRGEPIAVFSFDDPLGQDEVLDMAEPFLG